MMPNISLTHPQNTPYDLKSLPQPKVEQLQDALVAPSEDPKSLAKGVFTKAGAFYEPSRSRLLKKFTAIPKPINAGDIQRLDGTSFYAGMGRLHFGHLLMESFARLWALEHINETVDRLVYIFPNNGSFGSRLEKRLRYFHHRLMDQLPVHAVTQPIICSDILIPSPGIGLADWSIGTAEFRNFIRRRLTKGIQPSNDRKIYISRARLTKPIQQAYGELKIEQEMQAAGYVIYYPEEHSIEEQIQTYMGANHIIGTDGSAFHLLAYVVNPFANIGVIQRRSRQLPVDALINQLKSFCQGQIHLWNALETEDNTKNQIPEPINLALLMDLIRLDKFI